MNGERQTVIGFTEAELGFFLAVLVVVLWVASIAQASNGQVSGKHRRAPVPVSSDSVEQLLA